MSYSRINTVYFQANPFKLQPVCADTQSKLVLNGKQDQMAQNTPSDLGLLSAKATFADF